MTFHQLPVIHPGTVYLRVTNLYQSKQFYRNVLGLSILDETEETIMFTVDGIKPLVVITQPTNVIPRNDRKAGLFHFALLVPSEKDLGTLFLHLIKMNIPLGASDHLVSKALYLDDPDGNGIEIYVDRDATEWQWLESEVQMTTEPLDADQLVNKADQKPFTSMPSKTVMGHIHLQVNNLSLSQEFYERLGFKLTARLPRALFMSHEKYHHHIGLNTWAGSGMDKPDAQAAGLIAYTLIYPNLPLLHHALQAIHIEEDIRTIVDPSGIRIHLEVDTDK